MLARLLVPATIIFLVIFIINMFLMKLTGQMVGALEANSLYLDYYHPSTNGGFAGYIPGPKVVVVMEKVIDGVNKTINVNVTGLGHFYR